MVLGEERFWSPKKDKMNKKSRIGIDLVDFSLTVIIILVVLVCLLQIQYSSQPHWFVYDSTKSDDSVYEPLLDCNYNSFSDKKYNLEVNGSMCAAIDPPNRPYISVRAPVYWWVIVNQWWLSIVTFIYTVCAFILKRKLKGELQR